MKSSSTHRFTRILAALGFLVAAAVPATAQETSPGTQITTVNQVPKIATVNMTTLLNEYYKTKEAEVAEKTQTETIKEKDAERQNAIQALVKELQKLQKEVSDPSLSPEKKKSIALTGQDRQTTLAGLQQERRDFLDRSRRLLNQQMGGLMNDIRVAVIEGVRAHAATLDVDYIFDESGLTTNQVPFLIYTRTRLDLTADVLAKLNKDAPAPSEEGTPAPE